MQALLEFKEGFSDWELLRQELGLAGWSQEAGLGACSWSGVHCDPAGHVTEL